MMAQPYSNNTAFVFLKFIGVSIWWFMSEFYHVTQANGDPCTGCVWKSVTLYP